MLAPRSSRRCLLALLVLILSLLAAQPAMAAKKPKGCKTGQVTVKVGRKITCVKVAKAAGPALDRLAAAQLQQRVARLPQRDRKAFSPTATAKLRAIADRQLARPMLARAAATGPRGCAGQPDRSTTGETTQQDGASVTPTASAWDGTSYSTGSVAGATIVKGPLTYTKQEKKCVAWDGCPDADGVVHGTYEWSERDTYVATVNGDVVKQHSLMSIHADLTAHVGDDARVQAYEYAMDGTMEFGGELRLKGQRLQHVPTKIFRVRASRAGLDPHKGDADGWLNASFLARGPNGDRIPAPMLQGLASVVQLAEHYLRTEASPALLNSEQHFNDDAACLPVTMTPGASKVEPGERVAVEVRIKDLAGTELSLPYDVQVSQGSADVTSGTSKGTVTWKAPDDRTERLLLPFKIKHTSKRGVAEGWFEPSWAEQPPRFALSLEFSSRYSWEYTHDHESNVGTDSECVSHTAGSGSQQLFLDTIAYDEGGTAELVEGYPMFSVKPLTGTMTRQGELKTTRTGPASYCQPASETAPTTGCTSLFSPTTPAYLSWQADGTITLELSGWKAPEFPGDCPLRTPDAGSQPLHPDLDAPSTSTTKVSLADLKDPAKKVITVKGGLAGRGHEDCLSDGNGGCDDDPKTSRIRYAIDAWSELEWTLTMKRLDG